MVRDSEIILINVERTKINEVAEHITAILKSETMLAFQAFSRHDLDSMFEIGMQPTA